MHHRSSLSGRQTDSDATTVDDPSTLLAVLVDEHVQEILSATSRHPLSAEELESICDLSLSTIYRKIDHLLEMGLLTEQFRISTEGRHRRVVRSNIDRLELTYTPDDQFTLDVHWRD